MRLNTKKKKIVGPLRQTQLVTTFGCGSIVDLPENLSVIIAGTDYWTNSDILEYRIQEVNLESLMQAKYFVKPKAEGNENFNKFSVSRDIPAFIFPEIVICAHCGKLDNYKKFKKGKRMICPNPKCGSKTFMPSRFVAACENGHIEDFPYAWWVHYGEPEKCDNHDLYIFYSKATGGLDSILIQCRSCGKVRSMRGSFSKDALKDYVDENGRNCSGNRPWLRDKDAKECDKVLRTAQRGGTNLYFGEHESALTIPPWSKKVQHEISKNDKILRDVSLQDEVILSNIIEALRIHEKCDCTVEEVIEQVKVRYNKELRSKSKSREEIIQDEYKAFMKSNIIEEHFVIKEEPVPDFLINHIEKIILVPKLREVLALKGFRRIKPKSDSENDCGRLASLSRKEKEWYPAIELNGEGIFIRLKEEKLVEWENNEKVIKRINFIKDNMARSSYKINNLSERFVLLHTLSHLLIRQLVLQCGYSSSAIKEKIYSTFTNLDNSIEMSGILIYTATPDSEGSLGGLVSQGKRKRIENIFKEMLETASWCSSDPLCIQSQGQGFDSLNLSACHSCSLLPETSCQSRNSFLDRALIIGTLNEKSIGYFSDLIFGGD